MQIGEHCASSSRSAIKDEQNPVSSLIFLAILFLCFGYVYLRNAWIGDDAYITYRTIDNLLSGYGLTWNVDERVQVFTHPLWLLILTPLRWLTGGYYYTVLGLSFFLSLTALILAANPFLKQLPRAFMLLLILLSSKAFVEYSSSGLENPLSYVLVAGFYASFLTGDFSGACSRKKMFFSSLMVALGYLTRPDLIIFVGIPWVYFCYRAVQERLQGWLFAAFLGLVPAFAWTLFSLAYYGFIFPNTYFAKVSLALPASMLIRQGLLYLWVSVLFDPITPVIIIIALFLPKLGSESIEVRLTRISVVLYLVYTVSIGGDFMAGRFLTIPFLVSAIILAAGLTVKTPALYWVPCVVLVAYNCIAPLSPFTSLPYEGWHHEQFFGVSDERGYYAEASSVTWANEKEPIRHPWAEFGKMWRVGLPEVVLADSIGYRGFFAGPKIIFIDLYGIADPLLARLPLPKSAIRYFRPGHVSRTVPPGYKESRELSKNVIQDRRIRDFYDKIRLVTSGPLFSPARWKCIYDLNIGSERKCVP